MLFRVPVMFRAEVIHKGKRKVENETLAEWIEIDIQEIDDSEAPVATEWRPCGEEFSMWTRWHDGSHWIRFRDDEGLDMTAERLRANLTLGKAYSNPLAVGAEWVLEELAAGKRKPFDPSDFKEIRSSDREDALTKVTERARNVSIIGGQVWKRTSEPVYVSSRKDIRRRGDGKAAVSEDGRPIMDVRVEFLYAGNADDPKEIFRADRFDDMVDDLQVRYKFGVYVPEELRISVFIPESIQYEDDKAAFLVAMDEVADAKKRFLTTSPTSEIRAWCDLVDALRVAGHNWNEETAADLETAAEAFLSAGTGGDEFWQGRVASALNRWRARPIDLGQDTAAVPSFK